MSTISRAVLFKVFAGVQVTALVLTLTIGFIPSSFVYAAPEPKVDICHTTGNGWEAIEVNENSVSSHLSHGDFVIDENNPCPPVEAPELCADESANNVGEALPCTYDPEECEEGQVGTFPDCYTLPTIPGSTECSDLIDNDDDGLADWFSIEDFFGFGDSDCDDLFDDNEGPDVTAEEQCAIDEGFWNGSICEEIPTCGENEEYNSETNECDSTYVPPVCDEGQHLEGEGEDQVCVNDAEQGGGEEEEENNEEENNEEENNEEETPAEESNGGGGGGGDGGTVVSGPLSIGYVNNGSGAGSTGGVVLGASTEICSEPLLTSFLKMGVQNDPEQVKKLQNFLNEHMGANLPVTGTFGPLTFEAVKAFQLKYANEILVPWLPFGLPNAETPTGYVYKTTKYKINILYCATLPEPAPQLP